MIRRAILKGVAVLGYQVPFASGLWADWGGAGVQVTAACLTPEDVLKVIDQGADDTTNVHFYICKFFQRTAGVATTEATAEATLIQMRPHPEAPLTEGQILVYQVPIPEPLRFLEPRGAGDAEDAQP